MQTGFPGKGNRHTTHEQRGYQFFQSGTDLLISFQKRLLNKSQSQNITVMLKFQANGYCIFVPVAYILKNY
jgi:hypothetical protein